MFEMGDPVSAKGFDQGDCRILSRHLLHTEKPGLLELMQGACLRVSCQAVPLQERGAERDRRHTVVPALQEHQQIDRHGLSWEDLEPYHFVPEQCREVARGRW
jgi:hypothetical protein